MGNLLRVFVWVLQPLATVVPAGVSQVSGLGTRLGFLLGLYHKSLSFVQLDRMFAMDHRRDEIWVD
ncbi:hypothetical protein K458DRAFT_417639, partial [Lentithecium fluviatile CBS 122367]